MARGFRGVIPILQTPFLSNDDLDSRSLRRVVEHVCGFNVSALAFPAFGSEWWRLSDRECLGAADLILGAATDQTQVILNVTSQSTTLAVERARQYEAAGAHGLMCLQPFIGPSDLRSSVRHLEAVLGATALPTVLQVSPSLAGVGIDASAIARLRARHPNLCSVKVDCIPSGPMISELQEEMEGDEMTYLIGYMGLQLPDAVRRGAHGLMSGCGHIAADMAMFDELSESPDRVSPAFERLLPLLNFEMQTIELSIASQKRLLQKQGIIECSHPRAPGVALDEHQERELMNLWTSFDSVATDAPGTRGV